MQDCFYAILKKNNDRNSFFYRYLYKILKVLINLLFPIMYRYRHPKIGRKIDDNIIVSFTSFPKRIDSVWITAFTLLSQTVKPTHLILWLADNQFSSIEQLPLNLRRLMDYGLEIRFCKDLKSHKKYYYSMLNYPDSIVVTADDDVFYPTHWLEELINKHNEYPKSIICHLAHRIRFVDGKILPYKEWDSIALGGYVEPSDDLLPVGYAGVLYPPKMLNKEVFNQKYIFDLCLTADDLWLKAMSKINNVKAIQVSDYPVNFFANIRVQDVALYKINCEQNQNDIALKKILSAFKELNQYLPNK